MQTIIDTSTWASDGVWKIAPAGLPWIAEGSRASIGELASIGERASIGAWARIGEGASIGAWARIGEGASIGAWARIGAWASIGEGASIGAWASIGEGASIGKRASIGEGASIGPQSSDAIDLGHADGYRKCIAQVQGVAYIGAGCRWFTLAEALEHWSTHAKDRRLTMCLMQSAVAIADLKGWKHA